MRHLLLVVIAVVGVGCGSAAGFKESCKATTDCKSGLECLPSMVQSGSSCGQQGSTCGKTCTANSDCTAASAGNTCASDCTGAKLCIRM